MNPANLNLTLAKAQAKEYREPCAVKVARTDLNGRGGKIILPLDPTKCIACGLTFIGEEKVHLHHVDGNHDNWDKKNLVAIHESCHDYIHMDRRGKVVAIHDPVLY
jgi:5-methylcytosine-specific restriction endonuclease McrA